MTVITADWLGNAASKTVTDLLSCAGYQVYFVGGCVRNALIGMPVSDLDLTTDARPDVVMQLAQDAGLKVIPTGFDHGTVTVIIDRQPFEITTFRKDEETDGRHAVVSFSGSLEEDAIRRDFTMNALYCAADGRVIDPVGGLPDLVARRVRFINDPDQRIREDYLRILRFFRFYAWFGDPAEGPDPEGLAACAAHLDGLETLARERIRGEVFKTLQAPDPAPAMGAMAGAGVLTRLLPGADIAGLAPLVHLEGQMGRPAQLHTRLAAINPGDVVERLRLSNADALTFTRIREGAISGTPPAELGQTLGADIAIEALMLRAAMLCQAVPPRDIDAAHVGAAQIFPIAAKDLMPEYQGAALGERLRHLKQHWVASGFALDKDALLALP